MTIAEVFRPDGSATDMIDTLYDLMIAARIPVGIAELQDGRQLFVLSSAPGIKVTEEDVLYELTDYLIASGMSLPKVSMEIRNAMIDINP